MIYVLITVKPSKRFPHKNCLLADYTIDWLISELTYINDDIRVYTVGYRDELPSTLHIDWKHIELHIENHNELLKNVEHLIGKENDIFILAQLTQPIRRKRLLKDVIEKTKECNCCITYCSNKDNSWREIDDDGRWKDNDESIKRYYDGALYGWKCGYNSQMNDKDSIKGIVENYYGEVVDIDERKDLEALSRLNLQ